MSSDNRVKIVTLDFLKQMAVNWVHHMYYIGVTEYPEMIKQVDLIEAFGEESNEQAGS